MKVKIHIAKPFFKEVEQKITKRTVGEIVLGKEKNKNITKDIVTTITKPKRSKCIVNTLSFDNINSNDIEKIVSNIRDRYGIKLNKKKEMVFVQPNTTKSLPKLSYTLQKFCDKMKKQAEEYSSN